MKDMHPYLSPNPRVGSHDMARFAESLHQSFQMEESVILTYQEPLSRLGNRIDTECIRFKQESVLGIREIQEKRGEK